MKTLLLLVVLGMGLVTGKTQIATDVVRIEFVTATRGYQKQITMTSQSITTKVEDRQSEGKTPAVREMKKNEWDELLQSLDEVPLAEIPLLKSPSMNRASDGACASSIAITTKEGVIWSHEFDNENPQEKLQPLMNVITALDKN